MSRVTAGNVFKLLLTLLLFPFLAFLLLIVGLNNRNKVGLNATNKRAIIEGAVYAALFCVAFSLPSKGDELSDPAGVLLLLSLGASIVRSYHLRDLWLPRRGSVPPSVSIQQASVPVQVQQTSPVSAVPTHSSGPDDLASALAWVTSHAKQNKHRIPSADYVTILETCHTLDAVIDTQRTQPAEDAKFEYELEAIVREYLPTVLQSYLAVPPSMMNDPQPNGRTPSEELTEQMGLLSGHADALHSSRHRQTSADLTSNGNFLRERFGHQQPGGFDFGIH